MRRSQLLLGVLFVVAGVMHFAVKRIYVSIMPDYLPWPRALVLWSGVAEIAGGVGMLWRTARYAAAWGLVLLLLAVLPANVWMVQHPERWPWIPVWLLWVRLPLQAVLIWWVWVCRR